MATELEVFVRQVKSRSNEHKRAMELLASERLAGQMVAVLRQELDSMVRVIFLLTQNPSRREVLIRASVYGEKWTKVGSLSPITDRQMVEIADNLHGWTRSVYRFGCAFIHLSNVHDYNDSDPMLYLSAQEKTDLFDHCRQYHGGPSVQSENFDGIVEYIPKIFRKVSDNLTSYLEQLENGEVRNNWLI